MCGILLNLFSFFSAKNSDVGVQIMLSLIEKQPKFAEHFGITSESITARKLRESRPLQLQAHRIQCFLDKVVCSLDQCHITAVYDMAHHIGKIHYYRGVNFGADTWRVYHQVTVDQVIEVATNRRKKMIEECSGLAFRTKVNVIESESHNLYTPNILKAKTGWHRMMALIIREMKNGFLEEAVRNCRKEDAQ
jgi:hypothetical protein